MILPTIESGIAQGILWAVLAIGVYISYRVLDIADLTIEGTFPLGACVFVVLTNLGWNPILCLLISFLAGCAAGFVTGFLHTKCRIPAILSGILTMIALYSVNIRILSDKATVPITGTSVKTILTNIFPALKPNYISLLFGILICALLIFLLYRFFGTELGAAIRATGNNPKMAVALGIKTDRMKIYGLVLSNGLVALAGALIAQFDYGSAMVTMGQGTIVIALASIIIGEVVFLHREHSFAFTLSMIAVGSVLYRTVIALALILPGMKATDLKIITAALVAIALTAPYLKEKFKGHKKKNVTKDSLPSSVKLSVEHVAKTFQPGTVNEARLFSDLNLTVNDGDFITIIGSNGAGKSTLLNLIAGALSPDKGHILLNGTEITQESEANHAKKISRVFQDPKLGTASQMWIEENMALAYRRGKHRTLRWSMTKGKEETDIKNSLRRLNLGLENRLHEKVGSLSGGQRQAITLLMATIKRPELLLLDEHTAALDPKTAETVLQFTKQIVEENHLTTLMVTHNMQNAIDYGNRLIMLHRGQVVFDISGEEKKHLTVEDLLQKFRTIGGEVKDNAFFN